MSMKYKAAALFLGTVFGDSMAMQKEIHFSFRPIIEDDFSLVSSWLREPHVKEWWPVPAENESIGHFLKNTRSDDSAGFMVLCDDTLMGYIQYYPMDQKTEKTGSLWPVLPQGTVGTDQFIGDTRYMGKGYGAVFIKEFITYLCGIQPHITTIIVDPEPINYAAVRCYEKVGFKKVGEFKTSYGSALLMRYDVHT